MRQYAANLRAIFAADDDVDAQVVAEQIRQNGEKELALEEGDYFDVTDVFPLGLGLSVAETCMVIRAARNVLIRTRFKQCYEVAKELDKLAWIIEHRAEEHFDLAGYDYGKFAETARKCLDGEDPEV